jgi:predicted DsbA family dithiol-disulfide isomerase
MKINYKSFYLRPDISPEGNVRPLKEGEQLGASLTGHIGEVADEARLTMRRASLTPNSRLSFEASEFAKDKGLFRPFHKACYRAFWENGANLGQLSVLQQLGEQVGLDAQEMKEYLAIGHYTAQAQDQYEEASR